MRSGIEIKGDIKEEGLWEAFSNAFMYRFFPKDLKEAKMEEFVNYR